MGVLLMLRSVEDVAFELKVSKTSIYNKLKLKEFNCLIGKKQGTSMVDEDLFNLIKDSLKLNNIVENEKISSDENKEIPMVDDDLFKLNKELISSLLDQLKEKDKQIEELINLNKNNQILLKQEQDKKIYLLEEHFNEIDKKLIDLRTKMSTKKTHSFFNFFK